MYAIMGRPSIVYACPCLRRLRLRQHDGGRILRQQPPSPQAECVPGRDRNDWVRRRSYRRTFHLLQNTQSVGAPTGFALGTTPSVRSTMKRAVLPPGVTSSIHRAEPYPGRFEQSSQALTQVRTHDAEPVHLVGAAASNLRCLSLSDDSLLPLSHTRHPETSNTTTLPAARRIHLASIAVTLTAMIR
jgi:hypothetical protein